MSYVHYTTPAAGLMGLSRSFVPTVVVVLHRWRLSASGMRRLRTPPGPPPRKATAPAAHDSHQIYHWHATDITAHQSGLDPTPSTGEG